MITLPDAKVFMDAGIDAPPACTVASAIGNVGVGTSQMRRTGDWFYQPTMGSLMGRTVFFVGSAVTGSTQTAIDGLFVEVVKPMNGNFTTGSALNFETNATATTYTAIAYVLGDLNPQTEAIAQLYWASSGSVTLANIGETDNSQINGTATMANFREINQMSGADIAGGCTASMTGMTFALTQMNMAAQLDKTLEPGELSPAAMDAAWNVIQRYKREHGIGQ